MPDKKDKDIGSVFMRKWRTMTMRPKQTEEFFVALAFTLLLFLLVLSVYPEKDSSEGDFLLTAAVQSATSTSTVVLTPIPGSVLSAPQTLSWMAVENALEYRIALGTKKGGKDIFSKSVGSTTSVIVPFVPKSGKTIYLRLSYLMAKRWTYKDFTYKTLSPRSGRAVGFSTTTSITVTSPNGGETWNATVPQKISWSGGYSVKSKKRNPFPPVNIFLLDKVPPECLTSAPCQAGVRLGPVLRIPLAQNISSKKKEHTVRLSQLTAYIPDGSYVVQVCQGVFLCDTSDSLFYIASSTDATVPMPARERTPARN